MSRASNHSQTRLPIASLTLLALTVISGQSPSKAQLPVLENGVPRATTASLPPQSSDYTLGGGDRIHLDILGVPQYSGDYQIPPGGSLNLPLIGSVFLEGLTPDQAAQLISTNYARVLKRPLISVTLVNPRPLNVVIAGEVNRPGSYALSLAGGVGSQPGVQYPTLSQVIEQAGGVTLAADIRQVQIRRRQRMGLEETIAVDLWELLQTGNQRQNLALRDGDVIFVPALTNINLTEARQIATTGFAANPDTPRTVAIVGEVTRPGTYVVIGGDTRNTQRTVGFPTVSRAIQVAGGIKPMADIRRIQVRRVTKAGTEQTIPVDLWQLLQTGDFNQDTVVQDGDTIIVPTATEVSPAEATELAAANFSPELIKVGVVGEVIEPGVVEVPANTPLNQALLAAGGFNPSRARKSTVELIRLNPNGTVSKQTVPIDFAQGINEQSNPLLRNNDIIVVNRSGLARVTDTIGTALQPLDGLVGLFRIFDFLGILSQ